MNLYFLTSFGGSKGDVAPLGRGNAIAEPVTRRDDGGDSPRRGPDNARTTGAALEAHYRFILWLVPAVERFPRNRKFLLGDRIQAAALDVLERLIEATYTRRRTSHQSGANRGLEKPRFLFRLAHDQRAIDRQRYEYAARSHDETGHRVGAWRKVHLATEGAESV